jgi:hypothetical protein
LQGLSAVVAPFHAFEEGIEIWLGGLEGKAGEGHP